VRDPAGGEGDDGDGRLADVEYRVDELDLLRREVDVRGVAALLLGQVVAVPAGLAADVQDHHVGVAGGGDRGGDVHRIGGEHAGAGDRGDLGVREQLADRLGERDCGMVGPGVVLHVPLRSLHLRAQHRKALLRELADAGHREEADLDRDAEHRDPGWVGVLREADHETVGVRPDDGDLLHVAVERQQAALVLQQRDRLVRQPP
jgi:hypothetical protein